jgi:predicted nucleic acid-binding protein
VSAYVIDASAWLRLFLNDGPAVPGLERAAQEVETGAASFAAPELILVEAGHALLRKVRRKQIRQADWPDLWQDMRRVPISLLSADEHMDAALELAVRHNLSAYDALYLAVAVHLGATLFTADDALSKAARAAGV